MNPAAIPSFSEKPRFRVAASTVLAAFAVASLPAAILISRIADHKGLADLADAAVLILANGGWVFGAPAAVAALYSFVRFRHVQHVVELVVVVFNVLWQTAWIKW